MEGSQVTKIIPLCSEAGVSHNPRVHGDQRPARRGRLMFSGRVVQNGGVCVVSRTQKQILTRFIVFQHRGLSLSFW